MLSSVWSAEQKRLEMRAKLHHCRSSRLQWRSQTTKSRSILRCVQNCVSVRSSRLQWLVWHRLGCTDGHRHQKQSLTCTFMLYQSVTMTRSLSVADLSLICVTLNILLSRSRSLEMVLFESFGTVSCLHSIVTMALSVSFPRYCQILVENHDSFLPPCIRSSVRGGHCRSIAIPFVTETRGQSNLTKSASRGGIPRLEVTLGGLKLYHWIPGVGFPISVP